MPYSAEIGRFNPTCFLFLVDQSGSMAAPFLGEPGRTKAQGVADAMNRLIQSLVLRCAQGERFVDRYYIGMIGYGGEVSLGFPGEGLAGDVLCPVSQIANNPLRIEDRTRRESDGAGGILQTRFKFPVWLDPVASGKTLMCTALQAAQEVTSGFVAEHPKCYPPIVINISDGAATDGDPEPQAAALRAVASTDGNVLFFNVNLSAGGQRPILFPTSDAGLPDDYARVLFRMSSTLPAPMIQQARLLEESVADGARGFAFNADLVSVILFLDIGTRPSASAGPR